MLENEVLKTIQDRKMVFKFKDEPLEEDQINAVLQAGCWTETYGKREPRQFIVVSDEEKKQNLYKLTERITSFTAGIKDAPVTIAIAVSSGGATHFVEEGAGAAHNMALAAHSIGLGSYWLNVYDLESKPDSVEAEAKKLLGLPEDMRLTYLLPLGKPAQMREETRARLEDVVHYNEFGVQGKK